MTDRQSNLSGEDSLIARYFRPLATDPGATKDFEHFCRTTGCDLVEASEQPGGILRFRLRKPD
jgi:thiamine-monophosphate kinase